LQGSQDSHGVDSVGAGTVGPIRAAARAPRVHRTQIDSIIAGLPGNSGHFVFGAQTLRFIKGADWAQIESSQRYEVVSWQESRALVARMVTTGSIPAAQKSVLPQAADALHSPRSGPIESALLLLRLLPVFSFRSPDAGPAMTPSQIRKLMQKDQPTKLHWIAIQLVDADGHPVADEPYIITTPDNLEMTGTTDEAGCARIDGIIAGQCKVNFPNRDQDAWTTQGA
jgi:hypothetical protein